MKSMNKHGYADISAALWQIPLGTCSSPDTLHVRNGSVLYCLTALYLWVPFIRGQTDDVQPAHHSDSTYLLIKASFLEPHVAFRIDLLFYYQAVISFLTTSHKFFSYFPMHCHLLCGPYIFSSLLFKVILF